MIRLDVYLEYYAPSPIALSGELFPYLNYRNLSDDPTGDIVIYNTNNHGLPNGA